MSKTLLYCTQCDWEKDSGGGIGCANICSNCLTKGLRFVRFDPEEEGEARALMARWRLNLPIDRGHFPFGWAVGRSGSQWVRESFGWYDVSA